MGPASLGGGRWPARWGAQRGEQVVVGAVVRVQGPPAAGALDRDVHPGARAGAALAGQHRDPVRARGRGVRVQRGQDQLPGGGQVTGGTGAHIRDPQREPRRVDEHLDAASEGVVLARVPGVVAALGAPGDAVGGHQGAVQARVREPVGVGTGQDLLQGRGPVGDHVQALAAVPVRRRDRDPGVGGQAAQVGAVTQPAQHQDHLAVDGGRALPGPRAGGASGHGDPGGHRPQRGCGHIEAGRMRHGGLTGKKDGTPASTTSSLGVRFLHPATALTSDDVRALHPDPPRPVRRPQ